MSQVRIDHSSIETDFLSHLALQENNRILFTAPFGAGKSTFLKEVLDRNEIYFTIKLFPVNYSVSVNEDVFELIKFDLLIELLGNFKDEIDLQKEEFSALLLSQMFVLNELKITPIVFAILKQCGKIGKSAVDIIEEVKKQYDEFKTKMADDESLDIFTFLNLIQNQKGNEHEMDSVSVLVKNLVERVKVKRQKIEEEKNNKTKIQSVLIIDDLDRLDPEHTFRLINIFSAHFDKIDNSNKFGFDKVIFVCDFENIRKIFHHKYGNDVDFSGYTDKFFSLTPFYFDNRLYVKEKVVEFLDRVKFSYYVSWVKGENLFYSSLKAIINSLIEVKALNLRMLLQFPDLEMDEDYFGLDRKKMGNIIETPIVILFYLLKNLYGSFTILRIRLKFLLDNIGSYEFTSNSNIFLEESFSTYKKFMNLCLPFLIPDDAATQNIGNETRSYLAQKYNCYFHYTSSNSGYLKKVFVKSTKEEIGPEIMVNPYQILLDVFDTCNDLGAFKSKK